MLSPFLKKLIFVRQFFITDGKIEILGEKQIMLPFSAVSGLKNEETFDIMNREVRKAMDFYAKKIGSSSVGMLKSTQDIFETMGLGKMEIVKLDTAKKEIIFRLMNVQYEDTTVVEGVLCGLFSFLFTKDLERKNIKVIKKATMLDVVIR